MNSRGDIVGLISLMYFRVQNIFSSFLPIIKIKVAYATIQIPQKFHCSNARYCALLQKAISYKIQLFLHPVMTMRAKVVYVCHLIYDNNYLNVNYHYSHYRKSACRINITCY